MLARFKAVEPRQFARGIETVACRLYLSHKRLYFPGRGQKSLRVMSGTFQQEINPRMHGLKPHIHGRLA